MLCDALPPVQGLLLDARNARLEVLNDFLHVIHGWECFLNFIDRDFLVLEHRGDVDPLFLDILQQVVYCHVVICLDFALTTELLPELLLLLDRHIFLVNTLM